MKTMNLFKIIMFMAIGLAFTSCEEDTSDPCTGNYVYLENPSFLHNVETQVDEVPISYIERYVRIFNGENNYLYIVTYNERDEFRYKIFDCVGNQLEGDKTELEFASLRAYGFLENFEIDELIVTF